MQYGYFDETRREYVITRPDTPAPWANYLGSPSYGAIITNQAGGYSFVKSGARGRILRYRFNADDRPGRYIYLRDEEDGDFWSASWQPVGKKTGYETVCRHGLGYTTFETDYRRIHLETVYYVPLEGLHEVWRLSLRNDSSRERMISIFGYAEFTSEPDFEQDQINLQYSQFITRTDYSDGAIIQTLKEHDPQVMRRFFALAGRKADSFTGDRRNFLGTWGSYGSPLSVEKGILDNSLNYNLNSCGALHTKITLAPGEEHTLLFILGAGGSETAAGLQTVYHDGKQAERDLTELKDHWESRLKGLKVKSPDPAFDAMVNTWNAYQCYTTFIWSRAASLIYCGHRNGFGYRDTVQDIQGVIHLSPELAKEQLAFMLSAQTESGAGLPLVKYDHHAGHEDTPDDLSYVQETGHPSYRADDALWLFPTIKKWICETGDMDFLNEVIPFADGGEASVLDHLKRAIAFSMNNLGSHGLPAGLHADWNDCLRLGRKGESTFVAMQLYLAMTVLKEFCTWTGDIKYLQYLDETIPVIKERIEQHCFEGDRYIRGITEDGLRIGSEDNGDASFWLNPQTWAVLSGIADRERGELLLNKVNEELGTPWGAKLMTPPFSGPAFEGALATVYHQGTKENGSIFLQTQGWLILAEARLGRGNQAYAYYRASSPAHHNASADERILEPYVYGQFTESPDSPHGGRSHVHWLTGTASTVMAGLVEGILGLRPELTGLSLHPAIPSEWDQLTIEKSFRGRQLTIIIENKEGRQSGCREIWLNGDKLEEPFIPEDRLQSANEIRYIM